MTIHTPMTQEEPITGADAALMTASWLHLLNSPVKNEQQCAEIERCIGILSVPARKDWLAARILALLSGYYAAEYPASIARIVAEDWNAELSDYPEWCVESAVRWWKSAKNPDRRKRPIEGDISAECRRLFGIVQIAENAVRSFRTGSMQRPADRPRPNIAQETAIEVLAMAKFRPKRFGGEE